MRIADVVSRYLDSIDVVFEISMDEPSLEKALVLPERIGKLRRLSLDEIPADVGGEKKTIMITVALSSVEQANGLLDILRIHTHKNEIQATWVFVLKDHKLLVSYMEPGLTELGLAILTVETTTNRGEPLVVVARPVADLRHAAPWTKILASSMGEQNALRLASESSESGIVRNQLRLRNEYICQNFFNLQLETELEKLKTIQQRTKIQVSNQEKKILSFEKQVDDLKSQLEQSQAENDSLRQRLAETDGSNAELRTELAKQTEKSRALELQLQEAKDREAVHNVTMRQLLKQVEDMSTAQSKFQRQQQQQMTEIQLLKNNLKSTETFLQQRQKQLKVIESRLNVAKRKIETIQSTNRYKLSQLMWEFKKNPLAIVKLSKSSLNLAKSIIVRALQDEKVAQKHNDKPQARRPAQTKTPDETAKVQVVYHGRPITPASTRDLWVAGILDEMSMACFAPECNMITFTPNNWKDKLDQRPPHFLFVESAWQGNEGSWQYKIGKYNHPDSKGLEQLLTWCQERQIPTVFWNKEDPVHFQKFKDAARRFDHVFTTDQNMVDDYRNLPNSRIKTVKVLPFAAQPRLHNPIFSGERIDAPCFAGSYYGNRHAKRREQQEALLDAARPFGLVLYDRNYGSNDQHFLFPERFRKHIKGRLPYAELSEVYRRHKIFLNVNSVIDSPTMLSRRVFELLASGTVVVSTPSKALEEIFGDLVPTVSTESEAKKVISHLLEDEEARHDLIRRGIRFIFSKHTYEHRLAEIAKTIGLHANQDRQNRASAVYLVDHIEDARIVAQAISQQEANVEETIIGTSLKPEVIENKMGAYLEKGNIKIVSQKYDDESHRLRQLAKIASSKWLFIPDSPMSCDPHTLGDMLICTSFADADAIGEQIATRPDEALLEHRFVDVIHSKNCLVSRSLLLDFGWYLQKDKAIRLMKNLRYAGKALYCNRIGGAKLSIVKQRERSN